MILSSANISPAIPLTLGCIAGGLFLILLATAAFIVFRNRALLQRRD